MLTIGDRNFLGCSGCKEFIWEFVIQNGVFLSWFQKFYIIYIFSI